MHADVEDNLDESIECLKRGDIRELEPLVRRYQVKAARVAYLITQDAALAEDIMQIAFLCVYEHIDQYNQERPFEPWLMRIVTNLALKATGRRWRSLNWNFDLNEVFPDAHADPARQVDILDYLRRPDNSRFIAQSTMADQPHLDFELTGRQNVDPLLLIDKK